MNQILIVISAFILPFAAAAIGSYFTSKSVKTRYTGLKKPKLNPPSSIFGPVWTILYIMIGISFYLIIKDGISTQIQIYAIIIFVVQMILNTLWSYFFFGERSPRQGLVCILLLWISIVLNIIVFWSIDITAGMLLIPYLLWVSFASYLNYEIYMLNKE